MSSFCQSALISWLVPQLPSAELPILETRRPPELIFIPIMEQVPPGGADLYGAPDAPATIAEALKQRMEKYEARLFWIFWKPIITEKFQAEERKAKQDGNGSKARRMGRICKQYQVG